MILFRYSEMIRENFPQKSVYNGGLEHTNPVSNQYSTFTEKDPAENHIQY
jgi:hypothetical protein